MKLVVCAIRDRAADVFGQPMFTASVGQAIRAFTDQINGSDRDQNVLARHPEDFDLYELGIYDDATGLFETGTPRQVAVGKDLRVSESSKIRKVC